MKRLGSFLRGEWALGQGEGALLKNPTSGETVASTSTAGLDLAAALRFAREVGGPTLRAMTFRERGALLKRMADAASNAREALIDTSIENGGTTRSDAKFDVDGAIGTLAYYAALGEKLGDKRILLDGDEGEQLTRSKRFWGHHFFTPKLGAAVHINAFNFPAWGMAEKAAVALLAGMPVVTKPATATALTAHALMETWTSFLPTGAMQFLCGSAGDLLDHLTFHDVVAFTGSGATGTWMREKLASRGIRLNIEADSLNAMVLGADVEPGSDTWNAFVRDTAREVTQKSGQKCTATRRIIAPSANLEALVESLREALGQITVGHPAADATRMGPVASIEQKRDVEQGIGALIAGGAKVVFEAGESDGCYAKIRLLLQEGDGAIVHEREVFGPISTILPYETLSQAIELVAKGEGSLVTSIYSDDETTLHRAILEMAPWTGRLLAVSEKVADQAISPGLVLPSCVHGGPGRAGGGEELGGLRGLRFYWQRTAVQGDRAILDRLFA